MRKPAIEQVLADNLTYLMSAHKSLRSQPKLSAKSGIGQSTVGRILRAEVSATIESVERLAEAFHVHASDLLDPSMPARLSGDLNDAVTTISIGRETDSAGMDDSTQELVEMFPKLSKAAKHAVLAVMYREIEKQQNINDL